MIGKIGLLLSAVALCTMAEQVTISDVEDMSLVKSAYANDKGMHRFQDASKDTLLMNSWRC